MKQSPRPWCNGEKAESTMYTIFVRNWWRVERDHSGNKILVPDPGARKTIIGHAKTQEEARAICKQYNDTHTPGIKSRKAEYTSQ